MANREDFNLRLEELHKSVKVKTKPSKKLPGAKPKPKPKAKVAPQEEKKLATSKEAKESPTTTQKELSPADAKEIEQQILELEKQRQEIANAAPAVQEEKKESHEKEEVRKTDKVDPTLPRHLKVKNTFTSVFPAYGLGDKGGAYVSEMKSMSKCLHEAEPTDWSNHMKMDPIKRYTEEMLKAANMRGAKK